MIRSFRHKGLEAFYRKGSKAGIQPHHANRLHAQLTALDSATCAEDVNQLPSKDRSFMVRKTRHIPDIYKAGCTNGSLCNPPLFGFAAMPREGYGRRTDDSAIPPLTQVRGFLAEIL